MHEVGIMINIVETVEKICKEQAIDKVDVIVLQIGEVSPVVPEYMEDCYPAAVYGTFMEDTKLEIEIIPANALCSDCNKVYRFLENPAEDKYICPNCGSRNTTLISGRDLDIKELRILEEE